jgi:hypothetical protein
MVDLSTLSRTPYSVATSQSPYRTLWVALGDPLHLPRLDADGNLPCPSFQPQPVIGPSDAGITTIIDGGHAAAISALRRSRPTSGTTLDSAIFACAPRSPTLLPPHFP